MTPNERMDKSGRTQGRTHRVVIGQSPTRGSEYAVRMQDTRHSVEHAHARRTGWGQTRRRTGYCGFPRGWRPAEWEARPSTLAEKQQSPARVHLAGLVKSAITYFPAEQYHRLQGLNFCVRDGNRCDPLHKVTDKSSRGLSAAPGRVQMCRSNRTRQSRGDSGRTMRIAWNGNR